MVTQTENTAAEPAMLHQDKQDKYATENMMLYRTSLALLKNLAEDGIFTEKEYRKLSTMLARKYGLSSGSIFAESA